MLRYRADIRTLGFVAFYFALLIALWITHPEPIWLRVLLIGLLCWASWITAIITHNTIHCPIFRSKKLNRAFQVVLTLCYGHPVSAYVPGHNMSHHKHTQTPRDVMRTSKVRFRWNLLNLLFFLPKVGGAIMRNDMKFGKVMKERRRKWYHQLRVELAIFVAISVVLLVLDWRKFLLYWYIPHFSAAWGIITINLLQHDGCDQSHPYNHSRNFTGRLFNWFVFNNGYHGVHHDKPSMHWSLLPEEHERTISPHIHPELEQQSFLRYCFRAFIYPARRMNYDGTPMDLPPEEPDESWIPDPLPGDVSLGAET